MANEPPANLHVKRAYEPRSSADGQCVLVDRLWPRGLSKRDLNDVIWIRDVAPSAALRKWFGQPVGPYLQSLCRDLIDASDTPDIRLTVDAQPIVLDVETLMSLSLIVAELVTNSLKHAFHGRPQGAITLDFKMHQGRYELIVTDDGPGMPPGFKRMKSGSLGQGILQSLAKQLKGEISFESGPGVTARLTFMPARAGSAPR